MMAQIIKRGILVSFDPSTYTASVLLLEATSATLDSVPIATHIDGTSAQVGAFCAVLFFDENNPNDALITAMYPNGSSGVPTPPPGRVTIVTGFQQINTILITNGTTSTFTLTGGSTGIPVGALAVLAKVVFLTATQPAHLDIAAHGGNLNQTTSFGDLLSTTAHWQGEAILPLDASGKIDIRANGGDCTVTLYTYGYVI